MEAVLLNQRYQLESLLGTGGMATVYRARDLYLQRTVAVKILREPYTSDPAFRQRFLDEARAAARLDHPNVVRIYDVGVDGRRPFIVLELVEGEDLRTLIDRMRPVPMALALNLAQQICAGVGHAHRAGLVHCDLKPQNILITRAGQVKVADFGIARAVQGETPAAEARESYVWGSPHYIAPERVAGQPPVPASDVYSIGVILYEMLTGVPPFHAEDVETLLRKHASEAPLPPSSLNPHIPPQVDRIVLSALAKDPAARYRYADQFGAVLIEYQRQSLAETQAQPVVAAHPATVPVPATAPLTTPPPSAPMTGVYGSPAVGPAPDEQEEAGKIDWGLISLGLLALVLILGLIPLWKTVIERMTRPAVIPTATAPAVTGTLPPTPLPQVNVPYLLGLSFTDARSLVEGAQLKLTLAGEREDINALPGSILEQMPTAGQRVPVGSEVSVIIAAARTYPLPSLVGYALDLVQPNLEAQGLRVVVERQRSAEPAGHILKQQPDAGTVLLAGDTVTLTVSYGLDAPIRLEVNYGSLISLDEAVVPTMRARAGDTLVYTLRWRAIKTVDRSYTVFVHLRNRRGETVAWGDGLPVQGQKPTNTWTAGTVVVDARQLMLPADLPPGKYALWVGLYTPDDAQRLPIVSAGRTQAAENAAWITEIDILP